MIHAIAMGDFFLYYHKHIVVGNIHQVPKARHCSGGDTFASARLFQGSLAVLPIVLGQADASSHHNKDDHNNSNHLTVSVVTRTTNT